MLDNLRWLLWVIWIGITALIISHLAPPITKPVVKQTAPVTSESHHHSWTDVMVTSPIASAHTVAKVHPMVEVQTDLYRLLLDGSTGDVVSITFKKFSQSIADKKPMTLLSADPSIHDRVINRFFEQDDLMPVVFHGAKAHYQLSPDQNQLVVKLTADLPGGHHIDKSLVFHRGRYEIDQQIQLVNQGQEDWSVGTLLAITQQPQPEKKSLFAFHTYHGGAWGDAEKHFQKLSWTHFASNHFVQQSEHPWVAMLQHYFLSAWVSTKQSTWQVLSRTETPDLSQPVYQIGLLHHDVVKSKQPTELSSVLWLGPKLVDELETLAPGLDLTIDYGWAWPIAKALYHLLAWTFHWVGNWGLAIIAVTCFIKILFWPLTRASYRSMAKMRLLKPRIDQLRVTFEKNPKEMSHQLMKLYRQEKVSPLGGCLPVLIQIPVFIALYWVLLESIELRQAPFVSWIQDLSAPDPFYVLPVLFGLLMALQQKMNPMSADPQQAKLMLFLPIFLTLLFINFPSGLVLYWVVNSGLGMLQQWWVNRQMMR